MKFIQSIAALSFVLPFVVSLCPNPNSERCNKGNSGVYCYDGYSCPRCWTWNNGEWDCYDILADSKFELLNKAIRIEHDGCIVNNDSYMISSLDVILINNIDYNTSPTDLKDDVLYDIQSSNKIQIYIIEAWE
ncbi:hypothetical protein K502DRAFT_368537 [Neoconidiobolus thromboides FSU 785]|nr:hypothetical protein K502DRAFT_368537 [Neoconidiobolus thromboides FSU 785]